MTFHVACSYCLSGRRYLMQDGIAASQIQQSDLRYAGFTPNDEKCNWEQRQIGEWLSMIINNITMCFMIPWSKIKKSKLLLNRILAIKSASHLSRYCTRSWFHQFLSACTVGSATRLFTRQIHFAIMQRQGWEATVTLTLGLLDEFRFWHTSIGAFEGYHIIPPIAAYAAVCIQMLAGSATEAIQSHWVLTLCTAIGTPTSCVRRAQRIESLKPLFLVIKSLKHLLESKKV